MRCDICTQECKELTHLQLYVRGSEGISVCLNCRIAITEFVRQLNSVIGIAIKQEYLRTKSHITQRAADLSGTTSKGKGKHHGPQGG